MIKTESPKKATLMALLHGHCIRRNSGLWADYERAKRIVNRLAESSEEYDELIEWACDYVGV